VQKPYTYVVRLLYCGITIITLHWVKSFCRCERFITHAKDEENNTICGIGYGVSEAFVLFVVDAILANDLCDIKVHITAEIENPKNRRYHCKPHEAEDRVPYSSFCCTTSAIKTTEKRIKK